METVSANEAKQFLGKVLDIAQREPVLIRRHNRDVAVFISPVEYERLKGFNIREFQEFCDRVGFEAVQRGLTEDRLQSLMDDDDS